MVAGNTFPCPSTLKSIFPALNVEQVMDIVKVNEFGFLNEEVEEFKSRCSQSLVNARRPSYLK